MLRAGVSRAHGGSLHDQNGRNAFTQWFMVALLIRAGVQIPRDLHVNILSSFSSRHCPRATHAWAVLKRMAHVNFGW